MDSIRLNAFLVCRGLLDKAEASADETAPGAVAAVVLCDLAVETAAKAVLADLGPPTDFPGRGYAIPLGELKKPAKGDQQLGVFLDKLLALHREREGSEVAELAGTDGARKLRAFRNGVQHEGNVPSEDDVNRSRFRTVEFLDGVLDSFYGTSLAAISRGSLVRDQEIRGLIQAAETAAAKADL